jgi:DNA-directed RNA polymerase specialized sigma subunit
MSPTTKERDIELWRKWKRTKSPHDLQELLRQMDGVMAKEVSRWSGAIAREVLEIAAARIAKEAFENFDPKREVALSTYLTNYLQKLSREVYTHQNLARLPEYQTRKIKTFQRAEAELRDTHGRDPTAAELSNHLVWSMNAVQGLQKQMRKEQVESSDVVGTPMMGRTDSDTMVDLVYHDLNPVQKKIFEHTTGYAGAPILSGSALMKNLNITQGQLSYEKRKIVDRVKKLM